MPAGNNYAVKRQGMPGVGCGITQLRQSLAETGGAVEVITSVQRKKAWPSWPSFLMHHMKIMPKEQVYRRNYY